MTPRSPRYHHYIESEFVIGPRPQHGLIKRMNRWLQEPVVHVVLFILFAALCLVAAMAWGRP